HRLPRRLAQAPQLAGMGVGLEDAAILADGRIDFLVGGEEAGALGDAVAFRRLALRQPEVANAVFGHEAGSFLGEGPPHVVVTSPLPRHLCTSWSGRQKRPSSARSLSSSVSSRRTSTSRAGKVPSMNVSKIARGLPVSASRPLSGSMRTVTRPGGRSGKVSGTSASAARMKSIQAGSAARPPYSPEPRVEKSS